MLDTKALAKATAEIVREHVDRATAPLLARIEVLEGREPGRDGVSVSPAEVEAIVAANIERAVAAIPVPVDGKSGADGVGLSGAMIDRDGELVLTLTDGTLAKLGPVVGRDGRDGRDGERGEKGADGFSLNDFDVEMQQDGRTVVFRFVRGDVADTYELCFPTMIYQGVFADGKSYVTGDTVTWGGSLWHCDMDTGEKPGEGAKAWTLCCKKGRDARNGG